MRIGLFGGTFNPIHLGHLRAAEEVREAMGLDLVYFIPAASPPHKTQGGLATADHRLRMVQLATKGNRHFHVSDTEIRRAGRSYTVDTIRSFVTSLRSQSSLFLMMGTDAFTELHTWKESEEIVRSCSIIVHTRSEETDSCSSPAVLAAIDHFGYIKSNGQFVHPSGNTVSFVKTTFLPISASAIREKLRTKKSARYLLPNDVIDYLERHGLYLTE